MLSNKCLPLEEIAALTKETSIKPTLVPTGIKCEIPDGFYLELSVRSSCPLKHWLILANGVGIIDADYYNNPDNEGHIYFQVINLSPFDIILKKGDIIGQGILKRHYVTDDDFATGERTGGFGSTTVDVFHQEECVMACNPERRAFIVGSPKNADPD
jgi:dUTP pyrophosphatase